MKEAWCMAGIPCSGKTTTAKALAEDGYAHFERDRYVKETETEFRRYMETLTHEKKINLLAAYKNLIQKAVEFNSPTFRPDKATLEYVSPYLKAPDQSLLLSLFTYGPDGIIVFSAANHQMIKTALGSQQPAILDTMETLHLQGRKEMIAILRQHQVSPNIIIVQNTRKKILGNAQTRRETSEHFAHTEAQIEDWFRDNQPLSPQEKWDRVAIIDNSIPQTKESIRTQIANAFHPSTIAEPIPFLI